METHKVSTNRLHTMEYYSALNMKDILTNATTWMNIRPSEISQDKYSMSLRIGNTSSNQIHRDGKQKSGCHGLGVKGSGELVFTGYRVSVGKDE